ncbi:retrotransposon protein, putative, Ty3-gypsy subclass [Drepanopeziza brunnea f. sp. 'multigermtubi' MB_m1]|uniref:Retrotransposon protein, putative, Ty3-gypsy subclass n=1 Tax=Marssonina brunnea f. sp. multigermtubi (strain MB_m1) TaxID=1072389 RepID=K1WTG2_MARBU|nr:retrotransposon protein, putative, Ty3-gypsy subclass [Drepanopeziza brunnea f. sp. 'multigermtubi' MB_m1]EKD20950.1 retrotransposon protein, putative, Ty3-gypsy subclass [Drepanopeziza brunnea f. sp. 'multigermtubi' MB_m1]
MRILNDHGLQADIKKCEFNVYKTKFLGFVISFSQLCKPLNALTAKDTPFLFNSACKEAWDKLKAALQHAPILCHYDPYKQTPDALSRRDQDISPLEARQRAVRKQQLLPADKISSEVLRDIRPSIDVVDCSQHSFTLTPLSILDELAQFCSIDDSVTVVHSILVVLALVHDVPPPFLISKDVLLDEDPSDHTNMIAYDIDSYDIIDRVLQANADSPLLQDIRESKRLSADMVRYIANCKCAKMKAKRDKTLGLLVPLLILARANQHLTMDFTELPLDEEGHDFSLVRYFGNPDSIVFDRGPQFILTFWRKLCRTVRTKVKLTTAYNLNVDGQTESLNGITPFQVANRYESRSSFDLVNLDPPSSATERLNRKEAIQVATRAQDAIKFAQSSIATQQDKIKRLADLRKRPVDWTVDDKV